MDSIKIQVLGKDCLPMGFCQNPKKIPFIEYHNALKKISEYLPAGAELRTISMTSGSKLEKFKYKIDPKILEYDPDLDAAFNPTKIFCNCENKNDEFRPSADFVIFKKQSQKCSKYNIAVAAYSITAPVFVFESETNIAIGVMLKPQLIEYGEYIFGEIMKKMQGDVKLYVPICTHYNYPGWGAIPDHIRSIAYRFSQITEIEIGRDTETDENLFGSKDQYNNCVVVY